MNRIAVIGLGTLGGAVCKNIATMDAIEELVIIDYDIIESKNIHNSVYHVSQIGDAKVDALTELIENDINIIPIQEKYKEGKTKLPNCDLILDCRDVVCNRGNEIDVRLYITEKILIIDCRKNIRTQHNYKGAYRNELSKSELNKAGFFASQIICSNQITEMQRKQSVQKIDLNILPSIIDQAMKKNDKDRVDIIYDSDIGDKLHCLEENIEPILKLSKSKDIDVFIGERNSDPFKKIQKIPQFSKTKYACIPHSSLKNSNDLIKTLLNIVKEQGNIVNFLVTLRNMNGEIFIELLEETGAA